MRRPSPLRKPDQGLVTRSKTFLDDPRPLVRTSPKIDIPYGRIFRISPNAEFELVTEYDGEPNGLKIPHEHPSCAKAETPHLDRGQ